jgi:hypothetical protein
MATNVKAAGKWGKKSALGCSRWASVTFLGLVMAASTFAQNPVLLYSATAGSAVGLNIATTTPLASPCCRAAYVVAALINGSDNLEVIAWNDTGSSLVRIGSATWPPRTRLTVWRSLDWTRTG